MMIEYVVGFLFSPKMDQVVLINKTHPEWQKGFLNGVGGKIENGEDSYMAMKREFEEEAGLTINDWNHFCSIYGKEWKCNFLYSTSYYYINGTKSMTDEKLQIVNVNNLFNEPVIENLRWLIPMCLDKAHKFCEAETFFKWNQNYSYQITKKIMNFQTNVKNLQMNGKNV